MVLACYTIRKSADADQAGSRQSQQSSLATDAPGSADAPAVDPHQEAMSCQGRYEA